MNPGFYLKYSTRSLGRGGTRTLLAVFCIAVGVMAIVSLQLAGLTIRHALTGNIREANGGDIAMQSFTTSLSRDDLNFIDDLQRSHRVSGWTAITTINTVARRGDGRPRPLNETVVDPGSYPLVGSVKIAKPAGRSLRVLLEQRNSVVIGSTARDQLGINIGDEFDASTRLGNQKLTVTGILADVGGLAGAVMYVSVETAEATSTRSLLYSEVFLTTPGRPEMLEVANELKHHYPTATVNTTDDLLKSQQDAASFTTEFLDLVGLLALLVGGIGIANTMQVLLSRRRIEIAMLKTAGYRRRDLYLLFALEAAWLGLLGGAAGAGLGVGVSFGVTRLIENLVNQPLEPQIDPITVLAGLGVGAATALTFGILPIARSAQVRPLAVIRDTSEATWASRFLTAGLVALLGLLFTLLAFVILKDLKTAVFGVAGTLVALGLMGLAFAVVVFVISVLPVPARPTWSLVLLVVPSVVASAVITYFLPPIGIVLLVFALGTFAVSIVPPSWRVAAKLGLRGIGRQPGRTATTLVALFVGVFCVGLILILGQDIRSKLDTAISTQVTYNVVVFDAASRRDLVAEAVRGLPGLKAQRDSLIMAAAPVSVKDEGVADFVARASRQQGSSRDAGTLGAISSLEGYDLAGGKVPDVTIAHDPRHAAQIMGRNLNASDAGTTNVVGGEELLLAPYNLRPGDTITLADQRTDEQRTFTLIGFYSRSNLFAFRFGSLEADSGMLQKWGSPGSVALVFALKIDPARKAQAIRQLDNADPQGAVLDIADFGVIVDQILQNLLILLTSLASQALLAGAVIIANAVALAMLERRREIGIMKAVGYESRNVMAQVLFENALVGVFGGLTAIALVVLATRLLSSFVFKTDLGVGVPLAIGIIAGAGVLSALIAGVVAWGPTRVRPLEVLRYE